MHYSSLTHLGSLKAAQFWFPPLNFFCEKRKFLDRRYFMLVSANHIDMASAFFFPLPSLFFFLICIQLVRHVMVMQITCASRRVYFCLVTLCFPVFPFSQICVYSCSALGFQPLTKANDRLRRNDIRVAATCPCKNAEIFTGPHNTCKPTTQPHICSACTFLNSALWSLPSAVATSILRPVWADPTSLIPL